MSWFTKKKDSKDDKKESSVLAIETMHDDLENTSKGKKPVEEKKEKKSLKKSPFLMGQDDKKEGSKEPEKEVSKEEEKKSDSPEKEVLNHPASAVTSESKSETEKDKQKEEDPEKEPESTGTSQEILQEETKQDNKESVQKPEEEPKKISKEEEEMEKLVKANKSKSSKKPSPIVNLKKGIAAPKAQEKKPTKETEKPEKRKVTMLSEAKDKKKGNTVLPAKQSSHEVAKKGLNKSPFGVPKEGIAVVDKKKVDKIKKKKDKERNSKKLNKPLLISALVVFLLTMAAVGYNYTRNDKNQPPIETPPMVIKEEPKKPAYQSDNFADAAMELKTSKELLLTDLKEFIKKEKEKDATKFLNGFFIRPLQNETEYITGEEVLKTFNSQDTAINSFLDKPVAIFVTEEEIEVAEVVEEKDPATQPTTVPQEKTTNKVKKNVIKLSLMLELKKDSNPGDVIERMTEIETTFPGTLKSLMIEEDPQLANEKIIFGQATPEKRELIHALRYFNFESNDVSKSIEWGSLLYKNKSYIFFTTSKKSTELLLKALY